MCSRPCRPAQPLGPTQRLSGRSLTKPEPMQYLGMVEATIYYVGITLVGEYVATSRGIPDLHSLISGPGGDALATWRPCDRVRIISMAFVGVEDSSQGKKFDG